MKSKICTSIEQSKKLLELGIDVNTADMFYRDNGIDVKLMWEHLSDVEVTSPAWSLTALLDVLPKEINVLGTIYSINIHTKNEKWFIDYICNNEEFVGVYSNIFVDACYEMIIRLHEQKIL